MFSQDENPVSDASNTRRILTPIFNPSLETDGRDALEFGGKKRKRDGSTMEDLLRDSFVVKPYPSTGFFKPRSLQPLLLLPRYQLPLSALDIANTSNPLPHSRLFETHIKLLELEMRMGSQPMVLIARLDDGRTLYAVEREDRGLYVLCQLGSWVNMRQLRSASVASKHDVSTSSETNSTTTNPTGAPPHTVSESSKYSKKKRLAIEAIQSMVKRPSTGLLTDSQPTSEQEPVPDTEQGHALPSPHLDPVAQPTSNDIFETVRNQYFEALYLSKASLAYFAKGPLSRARAAFHLDYDSTLDMNEYITFLESLIMSTTIIDKKYKDGVLGCVSMIDIHDNSADEANQAAGKSKKRKRSKKMKPGKNGLYPLEDTLIRKWWASYDDEVDSGIPGTSKDDMIRNRISELKIRETQLQMIVMLEVLALHPLASASDDLDDGLPAELPASQIADGKEKVARHKKPDHLSMLIDVHVDRLCIWQSIALEAVKTPLNNETNQDESLGSSSSTHVDSILRDFCIDIIVPFFSARLPDRCAAISRKLGGPVVASPPKPKISKSSSFSGAHSRPGAATKRPAPPKPRRSLQRIRTDERDRRSESRGPNRAIALMRSATAPALPTLKREASEIPSLSSIPLAESQPLQANRGGVLNSKRFSQREVDMSSLALDTSAKVKKQAAIEAELKDAILALKRPNRELAGKTLVETAEQRSVSTSHSRKAKKPVRNPLFQGVQISATPKANRKKNTSIGSQTRLPKMSEEMEISAIPPSSLPRIPQSVIRSSQGVARNPFISSIQATPSRRSVSAASGQSDGFLEVNIAGNGGYLPSSPLQQCRYSTQLFNTIPDSAIKLPSGGSGPSFQETPIKKRLGVTLVHSHPKPTSGNDKENGVNLNKQAEVGRVAGKKLEDSIYKSLGWDDTDDFDELA